MANIISIATALPDHCHQQKDILPFMQEVYSLDEPQRRKLKFLYNHCGIDQRYSVVKDYGLPAEDWDFFPAEKDGMFPTLEARMIIYEREAHRIAQVAVTGCIANHINTDEITHLITVSCTGMSAPGLDLQLVKALGCGPSVFRTSVNFMGCYAAVHALKMAKMICDSTPNANVVIACVELCTLHFQQAYSEDNAASSLLFADGAAAVLVSNKIKSARSIALHGFYSHISFQGEADMAWQLGSNGFLMTLSGYIPQLISEDVRGLVDNALKHHGLTKEDIQYWCLHPGGKRILDLIGKELDLSQDDLCYSREILRQYGNMSSPTVLFVLKNMMQHDLAAGSRILGMAFGPGLTMETFIVQQE